MKEHVQTSVINHIYVHIRLPGTSKVHSTPWCVDNMNSIELSNIALDKSICVALSICSSETNVCLQMRKRDSRSMSEWFPEWLPMVQSGQNDSGFLWFECWFSSMSLWLFLLYLAHSVIQGKYYQPIQGFLFTSSAVELFLCRFTHTHTTGHSFRCDYTVHHGCDNKER